MKVLLTGASGILGTDIAAVLMKNNHEVLGLDSKSIDITDPRDIKRKAVDFKAELIIHSAAMTNVDLCEDDRHAAHLINVTGTENAVLCAKELSVPLVYISSCGVYGNGKGDMKPHRETDDTVPLNYHHRTKLDGEKKVKEHLQRYLIIRPGWLFGGTRAHKKNFVEARRKEAAACRDMKSVTDKFGSPTYTLDLARQINKLIDIKQYGVFNAVNTGHASRFDYVSAITKAFDFDNNISPVNSGEFARRAIMPDNEMLENAALDEAGLSIMRPWREALTEYIDRTYHSGVY